METEEIEFLLDEIPKKGTFHKPLVISENEAHGKIKDSWKPILIICNTDPSWLPGRHWVSFYFPKKKPAEFFDSFGHKPSYYSRDFYSFLMKNSDTGTFVYNQCQLQRNGSNVCGLYCILYCLGKYYKKPFTQFIAPFDPFDRQQNDIECVRDVEGLFHVKLNILE